MDKHLVCFNGSPHPNGHTKKAINAYAAFLKEKKDYTSSSFLDIPIHLLGCIDCPKCTQRCALGNEKPWFDKALREIEQAHGVIIGCPVYLDMPTAQTVAFLTRLNCMAESTDREFFKGKKIYITTVSYCSGTKSVAHTLMGAAEMLGFDIEGRSTREHIVLWKDKKLRGGMSRNDSIFIID